MMESLQEVSIILSQGFPVEIAIDITVSLNNNFQI